MKNNNSVINKSIRVVIASALFFLQSNLIYAQGSFALPHGATTVNGVTTIDYNGHILNITASNNSIINWNSFNIGLLNTVNFYQPGSSSVVLNRVVGIDPTSILGALNANGRVFIVNPNGVFFGPGSQINANGLLASTLGISNSDFLAGDYNFTQSGKSAWIINQGNIHIANGGYVVLLSDAINNAGVIAAKLGHVILATGEKMTVALDDNSDFSVTIDDAVSHNVFGPGGAQITQAIQNSGSITADGGTILLSAKILNGIFDNAINNSGVIQANSLIHKNGSIELQAVGGNITSTSGSLISAKAARSTAQGGTITLDSTNDTDIQSGAVIDVSGGSQSGNAGWVDISAQGNVNFNGTLNGQAAKGYNLANFIIDPTNATISGTINGNATIWATNNITITGNVYDLIGGTLNIFADHTSADPNAWGNGTGAIINTGNSTIYGSLFPINLNLKAGSGGIGASGTPIQVSFLDNVTAQIDPAAGSGGIYIQNSGVVPLTIASATTPSGNIDLSSKNSGIILAGPVNAGLGNVTLNTRSYISQNSGNLISGNLLTLNGASAGSAQEPIDTNVSAIDANVWGHHGSIDIDNISGKDLTLENVTTHGGNIIIKAKNNIIVGVVNTGTGNVYLKAKNGSILNDNSLITGTTVNLSAGHDIGSSPDGFIDTNSNFLNVKAGGLADLITGDVTLNAVTTGGDFTLEALSGNITLNGTIQSTAGAVDLLSNNGSINGNPGSNVIANADSFFSTPNGTIGLSNPVNVHINGNLVLDIGTKVGGRFGDSGELTGVVSSSAGIPLVLPSSLSPLYPPGNIFFNGIRIWPSESTFLLSQSSSGLEHFVFPTAELLNLNQVNKFDPTTSSDESGGLFLYHPLVDVDSNAFDQEFQLDEGAYDFIDGQIGKKHK